MEGSLLTYPDGGTNKKGVAPLRLPKGAQYSLQQLCCCPLRGAYVAPSLPLFVVVDKTKEG